MVAQAFPFSPRGEGGPKGRMRGPHGKTVTTPPDHFEPAAPSSALPGTYRGRAAGLAPSFGPPLGRREEKREARP